MNMKLGEHLDTRKMADVSGGVSDGVCSDSTPAENFENKTTKQTKCPYCGGNAADDGMRGSKDGKKYYNAQKCTSCGKVWLYGGAL